MKRILKLRKQKLPKKHHPQTFENEDTLQQLFARSRYLIFKKPDKWTTSQNERANVLFNQFDDIKQLYYLTLQLGQIYFTNYHIDEK